MGDGQHAWAAADWALAVRNFFVREEKEEIILLSGVPEAWLAEEGSTVRLGPTPTSCGPLTVEARREKGAIRVSWIAEWRERNARMRVSLPGCRSVAVAEKEENVVLEKA